MGGRFKFEFGLKFRYEVEFEFNLEGFFLIKKMFGFPPLSGVRGFLFPGGFK